MPIRYKIFYTRYDMYCVSYDPYRVFYNIANYGYIGVTDLEIFFLFLFYRPTVLRTHSQPKAHGPIPMKMKYHFLLN